MLPFQGLSISLSCGNGQLGSHPPLWQAGRQSSRIVWLRELPLLQERNLEQISIHWHWSLYFGFLLSKLHASYHLCAIAYMGHGRPATSKSSPYCLQGWSASGCSGLVKSLSGGRGGACLRNLDTRTFLTPLIPTQIICLTSNKWCWFCIVSSVRVDVVGRPVAAG